MGPILLFVAGLGVIITIVLVRRHLKQVRQREMAAVASGLGMQYAAEDPFKLESLPFELFGRGDGRGCENVLWGTWEQMDLRLTDYWYYEESTDSEGHRSRSYHRFSCVIAGLSLRCPPLTIGGENIFTRLADHIGFRDIEFESEEFNRTFNVKCDDRKFATDLIDARMMEWLLYAGKEWSFETSGQLVLCATGRLSPEEYPKLAQCIKAFSEHVPRVVHELYADAGGS
jgi:hypothetical protein